MTRRKSLDSALYARQQQSAESTAPATVASIGRRRSVRLSNVGQDNKENGPRMVTTLSKLKKAPLRGILKSPMRDMTAPINPSNFYYSSNNNDDEEEEEDYSESKTMNITNIERRMSRKSLGRRVSFAATARVRVIDRVDTPKSKQKTLYINSSRRDSMSSPQTSFSSENSFQSGVFSMPNLNTDGNQLDSTDDFSLHLSMSNDTTGQVTADSRINSSASFEHTSAWQEEYEVQVNQLTSSSSDISTTSSSMLNTAKLDEPEESDASFASDISVDSPFTAINQDSPLKNRRTSMDNIMDYNDDEEEEEDDDDDDDDEEEEDPTTTYSTGNFSIMNMDTTQCVGGIISQSQSQSQSQDIPNDDETMEFTTNVGSIHKAQITSDHFHDMNMDTTRSYGGIISQSQSQSQSQDMPDDDETMEFTTNVSDIRSIAQPHAATDTIQSLLANTSSNAQSMHPTPFDIQQVDRDNAATATISPIMGEETTMDVTQCVGGIKARVNTVNDVWMGAPIASITPDNMTMEFTQCVGSGIIDGEGGASTLPSELPQAISDVTLPSMPATPQPSRSVIIEEATPTRNDQSLINTNTSPATSMSMKTPEKSVQLIDFSEVSTPSVHEQSAINEVAAAPPSASASRSLLASLTDTPGNRRTPAGIREVLRMGTPGRLTPARPRKVELRSPRTMERRARTPRNTMLRSSIGSRVSASYSLRNSFIAQSNANISSIGLLEQNEPNNTSLFQHEQSQTGIIDNVTQVLNAALGGDTGDLFNITAPMLSNDTSVSQADKSNITSTINTRDLTKISMRDFLSLSGVNFMDNLTTTNRRLTLMPDVINAKTTPSDRVISLITETPLAELYEFYCDEFQTFIKDTKSSNVKIEAHLSANNPPIVKQYMISSPEGRATLERQFKINKSYAKAQTMNMLYTWRGELLHPVVLTLQSHLENLNHDEKALGDIQRQLKPILPDIKQRHNEVREKLEKARARKQELEKCDADQIAQLKEAIDEQNSQLSSFRANLAKIETEKQTLSTKLEAVRQKIQSTRQSIATAKAICSASRHATKQDLEEVQAHYELVSNAFGCQLVKMDTTAMIINYHDRYQLHVDYRALQITCTPNDNHFANMQWWHVLRTIVPTGVVSKFTTKTLKQSLQNVLHSLVQFDTFLDDIHTLNMRHQVEHIELAADASQCLVSVRSMDDTGHVHIGVQFSVDIPLKSMAIPQWKVLTDICSVNPTSINELLNTRSTSPIIFRQLTGMMDVVRANVN
ncbi:Spc7 kinetochore protein-domain-containing protein [Syncephalis plumigaleata]|nr:Spc7 kinetochore protein-domain-containing protein [Syncephalis plumigaleata]